MKDLTCIITGASRGIGLSTALRLARRGANIVAVARNPEHLETAAEQIREVGGRCEIVDADVGSPEAAQRIVAAAWERFGAVNVLVNNAGVAPLSPTVDLTPDEFERVYRVNIAAVFHLTRAAWPLMLAQGGGVIVNISSRASDDPFPGFSVYGASKAWVNLFSRATADEGKPHNIRVFAVAPGAVETELMRGVFPDFPREHALDPDDVAAVIESLLDERMGSATGETIFVKK